MIFVTVGTHDRQFDRLLKELDIMVANGKIQDVVAQIGHSNYIPKNYKWFRFLEFEKMLELQKKADFIISHGGVGSIMTGLELNKTIIVVPRLPEYNEHLDRHQIFTTRELEKKGRIIAVYSLKNLSKAVERVKAFKPRQRGSESRIPDIIKNYLSKLESNLNV